MDLNEEASKILNHPMMVEFFEKAYVAGNSRNIGTVHVRYKNDRLGEVEEISKRLSMDMIRERTPENSPRFYLAAAVAQFAELMRKSSYAEGGNLNSIRSILGRVSRQLPLDRKVKELSSLIVSVRGRPEAP